MSDPSRDKELSHLKAAIRPKQPMTEFDRFNQAGRRGKEVVKAAGSASVPGPSGVPYGVYRRCLSLLLLLWKILKVI